MNAPSEPDLQHWMETWQRDAEPVTAPEAITRHVRRRSRLLAVWVAGEVAIAIGASVFLFYRAVSDPDPVEQLAMALLALVAPLAVGFSWWNWRGTFRVSTRTTAAFLQVSVERARRLRRAILGGWGILAAELLVFVPWIWYRLYRGSEPPSAEAIWSAWGLLAGLTGLALAFLAALHVWARRDERRLDDLRRELAPATDIEL